MTDPVVYHNYTSYTTAYGKRNQRNNFITPIEIVDDDVYFLTNQWCWEFTLFVYQLYHT
jgi:hypothetical protein